MTPRDDGTQWFYNDESAGQQGPMSIFGLRSAIVKGMIVHATLVWHEGMGNWTPASQIEKIARMLPNAQS